MQRPKMPFYVPLERFAERPEFQEMVDDALSDRVVSQRGIFDPGAVRRLRARATGGEFIFLKQLFSLVMFEIWMRHVVDTWSGRPRESGARRVG